ncbi:MAG: hypothetical protein LBQ12_13265 [Deltaproteobacteria bacterium]|nr:hypothetical protein [Deltaproteobacteria bacterium]
MTSPFAKKARHAKPIAPSSRQSRAPPARSAVGSSKGWPASEEIYKKNYP